MHHVQKNDNALKLREWSVQQQWEIAQNGLKDASVMHERIKTRLSNLLSLSTTLSTASGAGAFSEKLYALPCAAMLAAFALCGFCCVMGLWSTKIISANISPETFDKILNNASPLPKSAAEGMRTMAEAFYEVSLTNGLMADRDRKWLKGAWTLLLAAPVAGLILSIAFR